jgi:membrane protein implicated in regulation of membrane protease activity
MRYSRLALLVFGVGGLLGLAIASAGLTGLGWIASATMAVGIVLSPIALVADWWSYRPWRKPAPKRRNSPPRRPTGKRRKTKRQE